MRLFAGFVNRANRAKLDLTERVSSRQNGPYRRRRVPAKRRSWKQKPEEMRSRYRKAVRADRGRLLDEFTAVTGYHRKYAIVLLGNEPTPRSRPPGKPTRFTDEVCDPLLKIWRAADYPWSARLVAMLPTWIARELSDRPGSVICGAIVTFPRTCRFSRYSAGPPGFDALRVAQNLRTLTCNRLSATSWLSRHRSRSLLTPAFQNEALSQLALLR
jgi:hypothetical protein